MEPLKVAIITPTTGLCRMGYAVSLARLVMYFSQVQVFEGVENQWLTVDSIEGSGIGANYHEMVKRVLADEKVRWTHILSLEDDMGFDPDVLHIMAQRQLPFVGCTYKTNRGWPVRWTANSHTNNQHYVELEQRRVDLSNPAMFGPVAQSSLPGSQLQSNDTAGVLTTRAAGEAFLSAGTNRRMWRFTGINYLCRDMEQLHDITLPVDRIRQDVTRSPGVDSQIFHNTCAGCHTGMDPMAGAFAYFDWDATQMRVVHTPGQVQPKYRQNGSVFPYGYATIRQPLGQLLARGRAREPGLARPELWRLRAQDDGEEVATSRAFSVCQVEKAP